MDLWIVVAGMDDSGGAVGWLGERMGCEGSKAKGGVATWGASIGAEWDTGPAPAVGGGGGGSEGEDYRLW